MSVAVRVIPCLDVDGGRVVKGVNFATCGTPATRSSWPRRYDAEGADELTFLDITASSGGRQTMYDVVRRTAEQVFIPLTVGGGVRSSRDVDALLRAGADKVVAEHRRDRPARAARRGGAAVRRRSAWCSRWTPGGSGRRSPPTPSGFEVTTHGGRTGTGIDAVDWARRARRPRRGRDPAQLDGRRRHRGRASTWS